MGKATLKGFRCARCGYAWFPREKGEPGTCPKCRSTLWRGPAANPGGKAGAAAPTFDGWRCERCRHEWVPRGSKEPRVCPKCKSPYWDRPRRKKGRGS